MISHIIKQRENKYKNTLLLKIQTLQENKRVGSLYYGIMRIAFVILKNQNTI